MKNAAAKSRLVARFTALLTVVLFVSVGVYCIWLKAVEQRPLHIHDGLLIGMASGSPDRRHPGKGGQGEAGAPVKEEAGTAL